MIETAAAAAAAAAANRPPTVSVDLREAGDPAGRDGPLPRHGLRSRRRPAHLLVELPAAAASRATAPTRRSTAPASRPGTNVTRDRQRVRRPRRDGRRPTRRCASRPEREARSADAVQLGGLPAQPVAPEQRRQGLPGRRRLAPAPGSARARRRRRPCRQLGALPRGDRPQARRGHQGLPREGARRRRVAHQRSLAGASEARSTPAPTRGRARQEPPRPGDLRSRRRERSRRTTTSRSLPVCEGHGFGRAPFFCVTAYTPPRDAAPRSASRHDRSRASPRHRSRPRPGSSPGPRAATCGRSASERAAAPGGLPGHRRGRPVPLRRRRAAAGAGSSLGSRSRG